MKFKCKRHQLVIPKPSTSKLNNEMKKKKSNSLIIHLQNGSE